MGWEWVPNTGDSERRAEGERGQNRVTDRVRTGFLLTLIKTRAVVLPLAAAHIQIKKVHRIPCSLSALRRCQLSTNTIEKPSLPTIIP